MRNDNDKLKRIGHQSAIGNRQSAIYQAAYDQLFSWCRKDDFAGHDPFDALNSRLFQATPFNKSRSARLVWTQVLKRAPTDLRTFARIPKERNAKGLALFALALLARHRQLRTSESESQIRSVLADLMAMRLDGFSGAAWGYNFDWQSRNFYARRDTPTIVPTAFAVRALLEAAQLFKDDNYLSVAHSACHFILQDLPRAIETEKEVCFSYAPQSNTRIHNANLLAAESLAGVGAAIGEQELIDWALRAARYVVNRQQANGSWPYGEDPTQSWVDNFHTAFILFSLKRIGEACSASAEFGVTLKRGYEYWCGEFFLADGWPKYYHDDPYPADAHAGASAIVTFLELADLDRNSITHAERVSQWTIQNLRDKRGFFYYQKRRFYTVKKPYMRWSQAWMLYALARLLETKSNSEM
jgi:hypothetical protein